MLQTGFKRSRKNRMQEVDMDGKLNTMMHLIKSFEQCHNCTQDLNSAPAKSLEFLKGDVNKPVTDE
jgi:hypothetical protein